MARIIKTPLARCPICKLRAMIDGHCVHCARLGGTLSITPQLRDPDDEMDDDDVDDDQNCPL